MPCRRAKLAVVACGTAAGSAAVPPADSLRLGEGEGADGSGAADHRVLLLLGLFRHGLLDVHRQPRHGDLARRVGAGLAAQALHQRLGEVAVAELFVLPRQLLAMAEQMTTTP